LPVRRLDSAREESALFWEALSGILTGRAEAAFEGIMTRLIVRWVLTALCVLLVAHLVPGFAVRGFGTALIAALVIGLVNGTLGFFLKIVTFPLTLITFGLFLVLINALMLKFASWIVPGFEVHGFWPAVFGALLLSILNIAVRWIIRHED
jgi:putative membrane protein